MGKNLIQQRRGKGSHTYRSLSFRFKGAAKYPPLTVGGIALVADIINCPGHSAPLVELKLENRQKCLVIGAEGVYVGQKVSLGVTEELKPGDIAELGSMPVGTLVYNIEARPGDGGKFVRASGTSARITSKLEDGVLVKLPSKKLKKFNPKCRATVGRVAGSGRVEKPFVKAGKMYHKIKAVGGVYPRTSGVAMNAVDHPFGGSSSSTKGRPTIAPKNAPPGRKVGKIRPKRTGKRK
ncbi:50S ribosomal protein L2 [Candidatus Woesearchaeota archaeon]|nr:50S ribosomal protein L2 [Candidatus Woesearchaeota archaeon]RLE41471.1 MAG: 50S ribosomal protein L2 [Candidatus Woesearchaeota archaeon]